MTVSQIKAFNGLKDDKIRAGHNPLEEGGLVTMIAGPEQFAEIEAVLRPVLSEASEMVQGWSSPSKA